MEANEIIFFDAEFTSSNELLELSVMNGRGEEIYHHYFKPVKAKKWSSEIHHITPKMVAHEKSFFARLPEIQPIFDRAQILAGFAVDNDIKILKYHGVKGLDEKEKLDIREFFWLIKGEETGRGLDNMPGLVSSAEHLGIEFDKDEAHSADVDTLLTFRCYEILKSLQEEKEGPTTPRQIIRKIEEAKNDHYKQKAKGIVRVYKNREGNHIFHFNQSDAPAASSHELLFEMAVENRFKAEYDLRKRFKKRMHPKAPYVYRLTPQDLEKIREYKNIYNKEEADNYRLLMKNLSRITL